MSAFTNLGSSSAGTSGANLSCASCLQWNCAFGGDSISCSRFGHNDRDQISEGSEGDHGASSRFRSNPGRGETSSVVLETDICKEWVAGRCNKGDKCRFRHKQPSKSRHASSFPGSWLVNIAMQDQEDETVDKINERSREQAAHNEAETLEKEKRSAVEMMFRDMGRKRRQEQTRIFEEQQALIGDEAEDPEAEIEAQRQAEERRIEEERLEKEREERIQQEKERKAMEMVVTKYRRLLEVKKREDAAAIEQYIVLESSLITYGAGLEILHVIPGYDLCQITIENLPVDATREDIIDLFIQFDFPRLEFSLLEVKGPNRKRSATLLFNAELGKTMAAMFQGRQFRDMKLSVSIRDDAVWTAGSMERNRPYLAIIWDEKGAQTDSQQAALAVLREHLLNFPGAQMETCETLTPDPSLGNASVILKVEFDDWVSLQKGKQLVDTTRRPRNIPSLRTWTPNAELYSIKIPFLQYRAQQSQWVALMEIKNPQEARINSDISGKEGVYFHIEGEDKAAMGALKVRVEKLAEGEIVGAGYWHPSFASLEDSEDFFHRVMEKTGAFVQSDTRIRSLRIYGTPERLYKAMTLIKEEVDRLLHSQTRTRLEEDSMDYFVNEGLGKLQELLGQDKVEMKTTSKWSAIMIRGGEDATHHLQRLIEESQAQPSGYTLDSDGSNKTCPICYDDVTCPEQLGCGHSYCSGCLNHFLKSVADGKTFPIVCMGDEGRCKMPIPVPFIQRFLPAHIFRRLIEAAFAFYLEQHPIEFRYCKTPDCRQTYRRKKGINFVNCPSCFLSLCGACEEPHKGMTCVEYRLHKDPAEQERLTNQLAAAKGYKQCPRCAIWIEKMEGCNHMSCKCGVHICWKCMGVFAAGEIYNHLRSVHGGHST